MTPVAALLNDALNYLAVDAADRDADPYKRRFSCDALQTAYRKNHSHTAYRAARNLLKELGCDLNGYRHYLHLEADSDCFWGAKPTAESQQARALWLTWAAMIAEEEGL